MDQEFPSGLVKKLAGVGAFLLAVAWLIGGEDDPGVIGQLGDAPPTEGQAEMAQPARGDERRRPDIRQMQRNDETLSTWYAEGDTTGPVSPQPFEPEPIDHSHLIDDARPMMGSAPGPVPRSAPDEDGVIAEEVR
tara:strand:+ start:195 stop:599 length:405 start_codon:yes stop_codon:yes gene_type:complete